MLSSHREDQNDVR